MPTYEYRCRSCAHEFELIQKITDEPAKSCPQCGGPVERLVSGSSFMLKGSGWYKDGYASKKPDSKKEEKREEKKEKPKEDKKPPNKKADC